MSRTLAQQSAQEALPHLLAEHGDRLYGLSLKLCGHADDAEDLVQEIFLIALRKWHQFKGDSHPTTWLYTIAARACSRRRRRRSGEPRTMDSLSRLVPGADEELPDPAVFETPLDAQLRREAREAVERGIAALPMHFRMPLVLKEIVELPIADVAAILGLKAATVKTRLHRARLLLRRELSQTLVGHGASATDSGRRVQRGKGCGAMDPSRRVCLDLLKAKQDSLDRGVPFDVPAEDLCRRCRSVFATLDLTRETCELIGRGHLPDALRDELLRAFDTSPGAP